MADTTSALERRETLGARIAAAQRRLKAREGMDGASIGAVLGGLNDELDAVAHGDEDEAHREMKKIEARLAAEEIRIEDDREEEEKNG